MPADAAERLKRLYKFIQDAADDAHAFAAQAASDAQRHHIASSNPAPGDAKEDSEITPGTTGDTTADDNQVAFGLLTRVRNSRNHIYAYHVCHNSSAVLFPAGHALHVHGKTHHTVSAIGSPTILYFFSNTYVIFLLLGCVDLGAWMPVHVLKLNLMTAPSLHGQRLP